MGPSATEGLRAALAAIRAHSIRSALTALGVVIGVASIVAIVALLQGFRSTIASDFQTLGSDTLTVYPHTPTADEIKGVRARLTEEDVEAMRRGIRGLGRLTPVLEVVADVSYRARSTATWIRGTSSNYQDVNGLYPARGRFLSVVDVRTRRNVCVVGRRVLEALDSTGDPIGTHFQIGDEWFKIVGVMERRGERFGLSLDDYVIIPYTKARNLAGPYGEPSITAQLSPSADTDVAYLEATVRRILRRQHELSDDDEDDFRIETNEEMLSMFSNLMNTMTAVAIGIVGISLLVGGIGIMNIMLVSVNERRREIGLRKALGATRRDIAFQFLLEAVILCASAGVLGIALGIATANAGAMLLPFVQHPSAPTWAVATAFTFAVAVGIAFGLLPAIRAAETDPIESLHRE